MTGGPERPIVTMPGRRGLALLAGGVLAVLPFSTSSLPAVAGLDETWTRISSGDPIWLLAALLLEVLSFASYMIVFRTVFAGPPARIDCAASYRITMSGVAATRLLAVAGAGGIALTAWALRRMGLRRHEVAAEMATFYVLLYRIYMAALVVFGLGLYWGVLAGPAPPGLTLVPAIFGAPVMCAAIAIAALSDGLEGVLAKFAVAGFLDTSLTREDAAAQVAANYMRFVDVYTSAESPGA